MRTVQWDDVDSNKVQIDYPQWMMLFGFSHFRDLILNLKFTEIQAAAAEREAAKLQKELDALIIDLTDWKDKYQEICVELEQTFNEMAGY